MKNLTSYLLLLSSLLFFTCRKNVCPPDEKVGSLDLTSTTLAFNPYIGSEKLIFKNATGDSLTLESPDGKTIRRDNLCVEEICTEPKIKGNTTCKYFASESHSLLFRDNAQTILLDILLVSEVYEKDTQKFYSILRLGFSIENLINSAGTVTDVQFQGNFNPSETIINDFLVEKNSVTLNDKTYNNVFAFEENPLKYYYTKDQGLVGFQTPDAIWNLDRIE